MSTSSDPYVTGRIEHANRTRLACTGNPDGTVTVQAEADGHGDPTRNYTVAFKAAPSGLLWFSCTCRAGQYHRGPVPCKHTAAAGRSLETAGLLTFDQYGWTFTGFAAAVAAAVNTTTVNYPAVNTTAVTIRS